MQRIFVIALVLCLSACASQPARTVAVDQPAIGPTAQTLSANVPPGTPSERAYLDDYDRVPVRASVRTREVLWLGDDNG